MSKLKEKSFKLAMHWTS